MGNVYKRLAALRPANTDEVELYATASDEYIVATLLVCNQDSGVVTYGVAITDTVGAAAVEDWIAFETEVSANITHRIIIPIGDGNTIRVQVGDANKISFVLTGLKIT
jgi:hypothetical protein